MLKRSKRSDTHNTIKNKIITAMNNHPKERELVSECEEKTNMKGLSKQRANSYVS